MSKNRSTKGITLIALIITIIILLILAGVSIVSITAENGILNKAKVAKEEDIKAKQEEILKLIGTELRADKILNHLTRKEFMDLYQEKIQEEIEKEEILKEANVERRNEETIYVITKENNVYKITENEIKYIGKIGEDPPPDLQQEDIKFKVTPEEGYTNTYVEIEIEVKLEIQKNILQYSTDGTNWINYKEKIKIEENGKIFARLINELGEVGESITQEITAIDKELPNEANIRFNTNTVQVGENVIATVTQSDALSGVDIEKCKYVFTTRREAIGTEDISQYTGDGAFQTETEQQITFNCSQVGNYYLHILTIDRAGNKKETVSTQSINATYVYTIIQDGKLLKEIPFYPKANLAPGEIKYGVDPYYQVQIGSLKSKFCGTAFWNVPVKGSTAKVETTYWRTGLKVQNSTVRLFGSSTPQTGNFVSGYSLVNSYGDNPIAMVEGSSNVEPSLKTTTVTLNNIKDTLYIGFNTDGRSDFANCTNGLWIKSLRVTF